ncbi:MAG: agmatine deiminase family protein [Bacteroidaceae bacterium]|nr:agmatine deiminase family protein [Bacteroidaceae bacterium]
MNSNNWNSLYGLYHGNHMVDSLMDTVFFSGLLPERCPELYQSLDKILNENGIDHRLLNNTKDIWCRDYMPIQTNEKRFVFYKYNPNYLQKKCYLRTITDVNNVGNIECLRRDGDVLDLDLVIDGGNVVRCGDKIVMTEKVFFENKEKSRSEVRQLLEEALECDIIFLPWDREETYGHSDGVVHFVGDNRVLMTNYADFDAKKARQFREILEKHMEVIPLTYNVKQKHQRSWSYINFLQIGNLVLVPQLGVPEDEMALQQIEAAMPRCKVIGVPSLESVRKGGALNCISWNVATTRWNKGFMGEEFKIH